MHRFCHGTRSVLTWGLLPLLPLLWRPCFYHCNAPAGQEYKWKPTYPISKYWKLIQQANELLDKMCSTLPPWQTDLHSDLGGQLQIQICWTPEFHARTRQYRELCLQHACFSHILTNSSSLPPLRPRCSYWWRSLPLRNWTWERGTHGPRKQVKTFELRILGFRVQGTWSRKGWGQHGLFLSSVLVPWGEGVQEEGRSPEEGSLKHSDSSSSSLFASRLWA